MTTTTTNSATQSTTYTADISQQIPGLTAQKVTASAVVAIITTEMPVIVNTYYTCNKTLTANNIAIITTQGTTTSTDSNLMITYGVQIPLEPTPVYPQADATCASNPTCSNIGLKTGLCCPNAQGVYNDCCSFCAFKPGCEDYALTNTTMCCPTRTNYRLKCCSTP
jgi:hypothetical protein